MSLRWAVLLLGLAVVGCGLDKSGSVREDAGRRPRRDAGRDSAVSDGDAGATRDAAVVDASRDGGPPRCEWSYVPRDFDPCDRTHPAPDASLTLDLSGTYVYHTDRRTLTDPADGVTMPTSSMLGDVRAIWVDDFTIGPDSTLRVEGGRPLLVAAYGDVSVEGTVDVSSFFDVSGYSMGAGADPSACPASPPDEGGTCAQHGGSGGGGGAFGGGGGDGGDGAGTHNCDDMVHMRGFPGAAGGDALTDTPASLRGGCAGRAGGPNDTATGNGLGGPGGGAIHIAAAGTLSVTGTMNAGGAGGVGAFNNRGGGGGGGSGGMIGLEAADLIIRGTARLAANGGGGGGGVNNMPAGNGESGTSSDTLAAAGGPGQGSGGAGGPGGYAGMTSGGPGVDADRGGGGGGGGVGFILLLSPATRSVAAGATFSPAYVPPP